MICILIDFPYVSGSIALFIHEDSTSVASLLLIIFATGRNGRSVADSSAPHIMLLHIQLPVHVDSASDPFV